MSDDDQFAIEVLGVHGSDELVNATMCCVYTPDFLFDSDGTVLFEFLTNIVEVAVEHRVKFSETYLWPGLTSNQVLRLKTWARDKAYLKIRQIR